METTTINTEYLDRELARIDERLHFEKLIELVPTVAQVNSQNRKLVAILHRVAAMFQKYHADIVIMVEEDTGLTKGGHDPDTAQVEYNETIRLIRELAVRLQ